MALARWQRTIVDDAGNILPGAQVTVRRETSGAPLAVLYSDRDGVTPLGNPFTADSNGFAAFHVAGGAYRIDVVSGSFSATWRYVGVGTAQEFDQGDVPALVQQVDAGYALTFESETSEPPSAGAIRFNDADLSAATEAYISTENYGGSNIELRLLELYSASRTIKDTFLLADPVSNTQASWQIDGASLNGSPGDYVTFTISAHAGETSFTDDERVNFQPNRAGADGEDGTDGADGEVTGPGAVTEAGQLVVFSDGTGTAIAGAQSEGSPTEPVKLADDADVRAAVPARVMDAGQLRTASEFVALSDAAVVAFDWTSGINFTLELTANRQLGNPSGGIPGTWRHIVVDGNDGTDRTLTFGNQYLGDVPDLTDIDSGQAYLLAVFCVTETQFIAFSAGAS